MKLTLVNPASIPALVNSVIPCGMRGLSVLESLLKNPKSSAALYPLANPETFVESAKSALIAITRGRPYFFIEYVFI